MRCAALSLFVLAILFDAERASLSAVEAERARLPQPIIAQLFDDPSAFSGRRISIYGLVVKSRRSGREFMLQDVSQRPLKVVGSGQLKAAVGDQLTVIGVFRVGRRSPYLAAESLIQTRVIGGGGCC